MFEPAVEVKTINYIRMSYTETGPDEYMVHFEADFIPASIITFEMYGMGTNMAGVNFAGIPGLMEVPTLEGLTYSPKQDDTYIYEVVINTPSLITFTVNGTEYQAEEGMTWEEFVNSDYNPTIFVGSTSLKEFILLSNYIGHNSTSGTVMYITLNGVKVTVNEQVLEQGYGIQKIY